MNNNYEKNLIKRHKEILWLALILLLVVGVVALADKYFNLGLLV